MIDDALAGRINLIITKSVSRFARNTVDSLTTIRKLKENGIEVYFEKENIWSFDGKGELLLTIMSSLAQEESRSISENCIWGQRKRMADGKYSAPYSHFLGYDKGENGEFVINEEQAKIVRRIFGLFIEGRSPAAIAKLLMEEGVPSPSGKTRWYSSTVKGILTNARVALNQAEYQQEYDRLAQQFEGIQARLDAVEREITETTVDRETIERFLRELSNMHMFEKFDESAWFALVGHMTVYSKEDVRVIFKDGSAIKA